MLVTEDMLGFYEQPPPFVKRYAELGKATVNAVESYIAEVRDGQFPESE